MKDSLIKFHPEDRETFHDCLLEMVGNVVSDFPSLLAAQVINPSNGLPFGVWRYGPRGLKALEMLERVEKGESLARLVEELDPEWYYYETDPIAERHGMAVAERAACAIDHDAEQAEMDRHIEFMAYCALPFELSKAESDERLATWLRSCELIPSGQPHAPALSSEREVWPEA